MEERGGYGLRPTVPTAMIIRAYLSPTDPVLAESVLTKSRFSDRVPSRIKNASTFHAPIWMA